MAGERWPCGAKALCVPSCRRFSHPQTVFTSFAWVSSSEMSAGSNDYSLYYHGMCITGLWPYDNSILTNIRRILYCVITLVTTYIQVMTISNIEITLENVLKLLSWTFPMILFVQRYLALVVNFPLVKFIIRNLQFDCDTLKNPNEAVILRKYIELSKPVIFLYAVMAVAGVCCSFVVLLLPLLLHSKYHLYYLQFLGFFYFERNKITVWVSFQTAVIIMLGIVTFAITESTIVIVTFHVRGLLEIASYRIEVAVNDTSEMLSTKVIDIKPTVHIHRKAIEAIRNLSEKLVLSYLLAIVLTVLSFSINMYRIFLLILEMKKYDEIFFSSVIIGVHLLVFCIGNYSGQKVIDSIDLFFYGTMA
ncbi:uncharacterized protein LOC143174879 isoform X3 [Nomia melanderi]|uniref:uncharacterized protein LOC143174879 isoform X3 n=1 Tax=Nomia melanderi TaxID=2448451 RepID=UPI003FCE24E2